MCSRFLTFDKLGKDCCSEPAPQCKIGFAITNGSIFRNKEAVMKKVCAAALVTLLLLLSVSCSSIPAGTEKITDLQKNAASKLGKEVVVVGMADNKTPMSSFKLFKLYQESDYIWAKVPEGKEEPPQGINVRVTGPLQKQKFEIIGEIYYVDSTKLTME
jgi:hypothetical protein